MGLYLWGLKLKISGNIYQDYKFQIEHGDHGFVNSRFINSSQSLGAQTFPVYDLIPKYMVKGSQYSPSDDLSAISPKTFAPVTKTQFLLVHDMCVSPDNGEIVSIDSMLTPKWKTVSGVNGVIFANHIPSVFSTNSEGVISSVFGNWNAATNLFTGNITIITKEELLRLKDAIITG